MKMKSYTIEVEWFPGRENKHYTVIAKNMIKALQLFEKGVVEKTIRNIGTAYIIRKCDCSEEMVDIIEDINDIV